jgi:uncharacterized lipoprotein YajG
MTTSSRKVGLWLALILLAALRAGARESGPFTMALQYTPQESVGSSSALLAPGMADRPVRLSMADGRGGNDPTIIGEISDHDDKLFPIHASNDVVAWAGEVLRKNAADWGIKVAPDAPLSLAGKLTQLRLNASTKALGSTYNVEIQAAFTLSDAKGRTLWEGATKGEATRYGHARSAENANEVLSDAIKEAYANAINDPGLQSAWLGKSKPVASSSAPAAAAAPAEPPVSPADLLADLLKLKKQGFTTDLLVDYVNGKTLTKALSADDLVKWKNAGMPQEVIKAALARTKG